MAYAPYSSTSPNPPVCVVQPIAFGGGSTFNSTVASTLIGGKLWFYVSSHTQAEVGTSDFISDGQALGMKPGDMLIVNQVSGKVSFHRCTALGSTYASLSVGFSISSAS